MLNTVSPEPRMLPGRTGAEIAFVDEHMNEGQRKESQPGLGYRGSRSAYLEADLEVLAVLAAATELVAETLVDVAAPLV